jgi:hypothetical protein
MTIAAITKEMLINALINYDPLKLYTPRYSEAGSVILVDEAEERKIFAGNFFCKEDAIDYNAPLPNTTLTPLQCVVSKLKLSPEIICQLDNRDAAVSYISVVIALILRSSPVDLSLSGNKAAVRELLLMIWDYIHHYPSSMGMPHEKIKQHSAVVFHLLFILLRNSTLPKNEFYDTIVMLMYAIKYSSYADDTFCLALEEETANETEAERTTRLSLKLHAFVKGLVDDPLNDVERLKRHSATITSLCEAGANPAFKVNGHSALGLINMKSSVFFVRRLFLSAKEHQVDLSEPALLRNVLYRSLSAENNTTYLVDALYDQPEPYYQTIKSVLSHELVDYKRKDSTLGHFACFHAVASLCDNLEWKVDSAADVSKGESRMSVFLSSKRLPEQYSDVALIAYLKPAMCARLLRTDNFYAAEEDDPKDVPFDVRIHGSLQKAFRDNSVLGKPFLLDNILRTNSKLTELKDTKTFKKVRHYFKDWPISLSALAQLKHRALDAAAPVSPRDAVLYVVFDQVSDDALMSIVTKHLMQPVPEAALVALNRALNLLSEGAIKALKKQLVAISERFIETDLTQALQLANPASPFVEVLKTSGSGKRNQNTTTYTAWVKDFDDKVSKQQAKVGGGEEKKRFTFSLIPSILFGPKQPALPQDQASGLLPSPAVHGDF